MDRFDCVTDRYHTLHPHAAVIYSLIGSHALKHAMFGDYNLHNIRLKKCLR